MFYVISTYRFLLLHDLGASPVLMGWTLTCSSVFEIPIYLLSSRILTRVGVLPVLLGCMICYTIRMCGYSSLINPLYIFPIELLHSVTAALGMAAAVKYMHECVPTELSSTAQGLLSAAAYGLGGCIGGMLGAYAFADAGAQAVFQLGAWVSVLGVVILLPNVVGKRCRGGLVIHDPVLNE
jgi:PPP family 3-phenylpropionic acid transporter